MKKSFQIFLFLVLFFGTKTFSQCGPGTPSFTVNLSASPSATYISPVIVRNDTCCGASAPDVCLKFTIYLHQNAVGINFNIASGAVPPGALFYQINCGPQIAVGSPICLNGPGPHVLTFCKPGNNNNTYEVVSIPGPVIPDSVFVRSGCTATLGVTGFSVPTIVWNSINPGPSGAYNSYLNCTSGCATVAVTPTGTPPPFVDYEVGGFLPAPCQSNFKTDTVRVYFFNDLLAGINPTQTTICFNQTNAVLTCTASGGKPPLTYSWSTGSSAQTVTVGPGTYTCYVKDGTDCPPTTATAVVNSFSLPISVNTGPDQTLCKTSPNASINGTVVMAGGGVWSGGSGTLAPSPNSLSITYTPSAAEIASGSVTLTLTSTGNQGCPGANDNIILNFQEPPIANAGINPTVCANNSTVSLTGSILNFSSTPFWTSSGTGSFVSSFSLNTNYIPSAADIASGAVTLSLTTQNNGACPPSTSTIQVIITPAPVVSAGANQNVCSISTVTLNGNVSGPTTTGFWLSGGDGSFSPSPNSPITNYVLGLNDIALGSVTLQLTSTGNGNCLAVTNSVVISVAKIATVNAGPNQAICSTASTLALSGTVNGGTSTGFWTSGGSGAYNPGAGFLNNTYFVSVADLSVGSIIFTLTSTNNGPCPAVTDTLMVPLVPLAQVNAGLNQLICENQGTIALAGIVNTNNGMWGANGTGAFLPDIFNLTPTYSLSQSDINSGSITFTLSSINNGPCPAARDTVRISIRRIAVVNAGPDIQVCSNTTSAQLNGSVSVGSTSGVWSTLGSGMFLPSVTSLSTSYLYSLNDVSTGTINLVLTSLNNGACPAVSDTVKLAIFKNPVINLNGDTTVCSYQNPIEINAGVSGDYGALLWSSSGNGTFAPTGLVNPVKYQYSATDLSLGSTTLAISLVNNGPCGNKSGSIIITIRPTPVADFVASTYTANIPNDPITFTNKSTGATIYNWDFGDNNSTNLKDPIHNYVNAGFYDVRLIAINDFGCRDTSIQRITVKSDIQFPNVFTPNLAGPNGGTYNPNDYSNDVFFPYTSGVTEYDLKIFNRYGELIFQSNDLKIGWDGYFNGKLCQQDAYVWKANVTFFDGRVYQKVGSVTLLR